MGYVIPGFWARDPWRSDDVTALGYMFELAHGMSPWLHPQLDGAFQTDNGPLPFWLGAWAIQFNQAMDLGLTDPWAVRIPFVGILAWTLCSVWFGIFTLAQHASLQPVAFAFGGEASAKDYAHTLADGGLLAFMACLGLAQLSHETTPALMQLGLVAWLFYAFALLPFKPVPAVLGIVSGLLALSLSGAPVVALCLSLASLWVQNASRISLKGRKSVLLLALTSVIIFMLAYKWDLTLWTLDAPRSLEQWQRAGSLLVWFTWPVWPLVLWSLWSWRKQVFRLGQPDPIWLPLIFAAVTVGTTLLTGASDKSLLLALPSLACLAALALPTLNRSVSSFIDWFTLLFFTVCGVVIWVIWISLHTGIPHQPATNVARLAPDFQPDFEVWSFLVALLASLSWAWLVRWRVGRNRAALWKSMVLPAGGAALCWLLLTTLWMPLLNHARSYDTLVQKISREVGPATCVQYFGLPLGLISSLKFLSPLSVQPANTAAQCPWLLVSQDIADQIPDLVSRSEWKQVAAWGHPKAGEEDVVLFANVSHTQP
jgi:hypothetical protein